MEFSDDTALARRPGVVEAEVADTHVLLNDDLHYFGLDAVGRRIWELLEAPRSVADLVSALTEEFAVTPTECRADVEAFVASLLDRHLVDVT